MKKKGMDVHPLSLVVVAALLIAVLVVLFYFLPKISSSGKSSEDIVSPLYKCRCIPPGSSNVCAANVSDGEKYITRGDAPAECSGWEDCETKCWKQI